MAKIKLTKTVIDADSRRPTMLNSGTRRFRAYCAGLSTPSCGNSMSIRNNLLIATGLSNFCASEFPYRLAPPNGRYSGRGQGHAVRGNQGPSSSRPIPVVFAC